MTHAPHLRQKARTLRSERRLTIDQLAERLALSRSTIYYWVRDLPIPGSRCGGEWTEAGRRKGNRAMQRKYRLLREEAYRRGAEEFDHLAADPTFRDFVCLYVGEGFKRNRNTVAIANSDPAVMCVSTRWLRALSDKPVRFSIQYHADQDLAALRDFWGELLETDPGAIRLLRKSNSNRLEGRNWRSRHGVITALVYDTFLRARVQAWIDRMNRDWR